MPLDPVIVLVIKNCQTCFIIELLQPLHSQPAPVPHLQCSSFYPSKVIWLRFSCISPPAPECESAWDVCWWDPLVTVSPEPAIDVNRLKMRGVTAFVLEITLPSRCEDRAHIVRRNKIKQAGAELCQAQFS